MRVDGRELRRGQDAESLIDGSEQDDVTPIHCSGDPIDGEEVEPGRADAYALEIDSAMSPNR